MKKQRITVSHWETRRKLLEALGSVIREQEAGADRCSKLVAEGKLKGNALAYFEAEADRHIATIAELRAIDIRFTTTPEPQ